MPCCAHLSWMFDPCIFFFGTSKAKEPVPCGVLYDTPLYEACSFGTMDEVGMCSWKEKGGGVCGLKAYSVW